MANNLNATSLKIEADQLGKDPVKVERAYQLLRILDGLNKNPKTQGKFSLRGGTAFNLFRANIPRVSQDIDLNYTGSVSSEDCRADMPVVNQGIQEVLGTLGFSTIHPPETLREHTWHMEYDSVLGGKQPLSIDINYFNRVPLFSPKESQSVSICGFNTNFQVLNNFDLVAGKFNALFTRGKIAARDVYDIYRILTQKLVDIHDPHFRVPFMVEVASHKPQLVEYSRSDKQYPITSKLNYGNFLNEMKKSLSREAWMELAPGGNLSRERFNEIRSTVEEACIALLKFSPQEVRFVRSLREKAKIRPELLLSGTAMPEPTKAELSRRIFANSYLNFIRESMPTTGAAERKWRNIARAHEAYESGEPVYIGSLIQQRARELGIAEELAYDDERLIKRAAREIQKCDPRLSRQDAVDQCIRDIEMLRYNAKKRGRSRD